MPDSRVSGLEMTLLVGGVLLIALAGIVIPFAPLVSCPRGFRSQGGNTIIAGINTDHACCELCGQTGRITLLKLWRCP